MGTTKRARQTANDDKPKLSQLDHELQLANKANADHEAARRRRSVDEPTITISLTVEQLDLLDNAATDNIVEWRKELKRRIAASAIIGNLEHNLEQLEQTRDKLRAGLRKHGYLR